MSKKHKISTKFWIVIGSIFLWFINICWIDYELKYWDVPTTIKMQYNHPHTYSITIIMWMINGSVLAKVLMIYIPKFNAWLDREK